MELQDASWQWLATQDAKCKIGGGGCKKKNTLKSELPTGNNILTDEKQIDDDSNPKPNAYRTWHSVANFCKSLDGVERVSGNDFPYSKSSPLG